MSKKIILPIIKMVLGVAMIVLSLVGFIPEPESFVEMTFVSNFAGGAILLADGILYFKNKSIPSIVYRNLVGCLLCVFLICTGSLTGAYNMNFKGVFLFLHTVFPILFLLIYIIFVNDREGNVIVKVATTPILTIVYLLFDYIYGNISGKFVYGIVTPNELNFLYALLLSLFGWFFIEFNKIAHPIKDKDKNLYK